MEVGKMFMNTGEVNGIFFREWGSGNQKTAILLHGLASSSASWERVAEVLVGRGYHVIAPDLPGHGLSLRLNSYEISAVCELLKPALPLNPDIVIGHSLGGLLLTSLSAHLHSTKMILLDPVFTFPRKGVLEKLVKFFLLNMARERLRVLQRKAKKWSEFEINTEFLTRKQWHTESVNILDSVAVNTAAKAFSESSQEVLCLLAKHTLLVTTKFQKELKGRNFKLVTLSKAGHNLHRDSFDETMEAVLLFASAS
jgi:pimeloyl-ACP methyl ester carboxylesterase